MPRASCAYARGPQQALVACYARGSAICTRGTSPVLVCDAVICPPCDFRSSITSITATDTMSMPISDGCGALKSSVCALASWHSAVLLPSAIAMNSMPLWS